MTERQTVAGAYQKIESHEELCAERYKAIADTLASLKQNASDHGKLLVGILLALAGGLATTLLAIILKAGHLA